MTGIVRKTLIQGIAAGILLVSSIGAVGAAGSRAAASQASKTYVNKSDAYSINYPSNWVLTSNIDTKNIGKVERGISSHGAQLVSSDHVGVSGILVHAGSTSDAKVKANVQALITENTVVIGQLHWSTLKISGVTFIEAGALEKAYGTVQGSVYMMGASHNGHTYYFFRALLLKQKSTAMHNGELTSMINSIKLM